jgi:CRP-like cAMP-binding protein
MHIGLKGADLIALQIIKVYADGGTCCLSYDELGEKTGYCARTMIRSIQHLHRLRLIDVGKSYGDRRNRYRLLV